MCPEYWTRPTTRQWVKFLRTNWLTLFIICRDDRWIAVMIHVSGRQAVLLPGERSHENNLLPRGQKDFLPEWSWSTTFRISTMKNPSFLYKSRKNRTGKKTMYHIVIMAIYCFFVALLAVRFIRGVPVCLLQTLRTQTWVNALHRAKLAEETRKPKAIIMGKQHRIYRRNIQFFLRRDTNGIQISGNHKKSMEKIPTL